MYVHIIHDSARSPNTSVPSLRDMSIEEDTVHRVIKPMEIDEVIEEEKTKNQYKVFIRYYSLLLSKFMLCKFKLMLGQFIRIYSIRGISFLRKIVKAWWGLERPTAYFILFEIHNFKLILFIGLTIIFIVLTFNPIQPQLAFNTIYTHFCYKKTSSSTLNVSDK